MTDKTLPEAVFDTIVEDPKADGGLDDSARAAEPGNFLRHVAALSASKISDGLINPKLVLSWLLMQLGAGAFWAGLLVPVRESLALLPQVVTAPRIAAQPLRKWFWAGGAMVQGLCALGIAAAALTLQGNAAGLAIVGLLAVLALARSVCSASYKDILGKTVGSSRRGTVTGTASSAASLGVIAFALLLMTGWGDRMTLVLAGLCVAGGLWLIGGAVLGSLREEPSQTSDDTRVVVRFAALREDAQLRRFVIVRSLLVGTALAPPFLVTLGEDGALGVLGALVLASALASLVSSFVWGRLSDRSSRRVLVYAGLAGAAVLALVCLAALTGLATVTGVVPVLLFALMIAYEGVRQGRSTHLVDMAGEADRAAYTALSNTAVGVVLIVAGGASAAVGAVSVPLALALFSVMCLAGGLLALKLDEVQDHG